MRTRAAYYTQRNGGVWRTARVVHRCDWRNVGIRCKHDILPGERYFDTKLPNPDSRSEYGTYRICADCANEIVNV